MDVPLCKENGQNGSFIFFLLYRGTNFQNVCEVSRSFFPNRVCGRVNSGAFF